MGGKTRIEWTDATWNPVRGCSRVSEGCRNCYAERQAIRQAGPGGKYEGLVTITNGHPQWTGDIRVVPEKLGEPLQWRKARRIFVNSMSDLFHENVPDQFITDVFGIMALGFWHQFQILTKRPERALAYFQAGDHGIIEQFRAIEVRGGVGPVEMFRAMDRRRWSIKEWQWPLPNVWLGVSVEDQETADERIPILLQTPAAVRFVSYEPALGDVNFCSVQVDLGIKANVLVRYCDHPFGSMLTPSARIDWVIAGGESGPGARPSHPDWFRSVQQQCSAAGVAFFMKQMTERGRKIPFEQWPEELKVREFPETVAGEII